MNLIESPDDELKPRIDERTVPMPKLRDLLTVAVVFAVPVLGWTTIFLVARRNRRTQRRQDPPSRPPA